MTESDAGSRAGEERVATLAAQRVLAIDGSVVRLRQAWGSRPVVQVLLRHFGCIFCHQMVADVLAVTPTIASHGGHVVLVGCGTVEHATKFAKHKRLPREGVTLYCDPGRESYDAIGLEHSYAKTFFSGGARAAYVAARKAGHRVSGVAGDIAQLGGAFVIAPPARLLYEHRSRFAGDHPSVGAILEALRSA
jgi:peroxiredoxin